LKSRLLGELGFVFQPNIFVWNDPRWSKRQDMQRLVEAHGRQCAFRSFL
jgi:hypothetical protein